jgi:hypothetical protein
MGKSDITVIQFQNYTVLRGSVKIIVRYQAWTVPTASLNLSTRQLESTQWSCIIMHSKKTWFKIIPG